MSLTLHILICLLIPGSIAIAAALLTISACYQRPTVGQLARTILLLAVNMAAVVLLFQKTINGEGAMLVPVAVICTAFAFAMFQFATALLFGAVDRLRRLAS
jgi:hypothetical protein